jgi:hypothetical protein
MCLAFYEQKRWRASIFITGDAAGPNESAKKNRDADQDEKLEASETFFCNSNGRANAQNKMSAICFCHARPSFFRGGQRRRHLLDHGEEGRGPTAMHEENASRDTSLNALNQQLSDLTAQVIQLTVTIAAVASNPAVLKIMTDRFAVLNEMVDSWPR